MARDIAYIYGFFDAIYVPRAARDAEKDRINDFESEAKC